MFSCRKLPIGLQFLGHPTRENRKCFRRLTSQLRFSARDIENDHVTVSGTIRRETTFKTQPAVIPSPSCSAGAFQGVVCFLRATPFFMHRRKLPASKQRLLHRPVHTDAAREDEPAEPREFRGVGTETLPDQFRSLNRNGTIAERCGQVASQNGATPAPAGDAGHGRGRGRRHRSDAR